MRLSASLTIAAMLLAVMPVSVTWAAPEDPQAEMDKKLAQKISVDFQGTELTGVLQFFRDRTGVNIILDRGRDEGTTPRVTLKLDDVQAESALAWAVRLAGYTYVVRDQAIYVAKDNLIQPEWRQAMQERYIRRLGDDRQGWMRQINLRLGAKVDVKFTGEPIDRVMESLAREGGVNIVVDPAVVPNSPPIRFDLRQMTLENVINWATRMAGLKHVVQDEVLYVTDNPGMARLRLETGTSIVPPRFRVPVTYEFNQTTLKRALQHLENLSEVKIELQNPPADDTPVTLSGTKVELDRAVRMLLNQTGLQYAISYRENSIVVVFLAKPADKLEAPVK